jgi:hypothetical protein
VSKTCKTGWCPLFLGCKHPSDQGGMLAQRYQGLFRGRVFVFFVYSGRRRARNTHDKSVMMPRRIHMLSLLLHPTASQPEPCAPPSSQSLPPLLKTRNGIHHLSNLPLQNRPLRCNAVDQPPTTSPASRPFANGFRHRIGPTRGMS